MNDPEQFEGAWKEYDRYRDAIIEVADAFQSAMQQWAQRFVDWAEANGEIIEDFTDEMYAEELNDPYWAEEEDDVFV